MFDSRRDLGRARLHPFVASGRLALSMGDNHFITVSRAGVLMARRKGRPPVAIAHASEGLRVSPDEPALARGVPPELIVRFRHGGDNREVCVLDVNVGEFVLEIEPFMERYSVSGPELGRWMRAAVEAVLSEKYR